jgi:multidrug efflux pump subunit AcrA (membrane-fusion protein)
LLVVMFLAALVIAWGVWRHVETTRQAEQFEQANSETVVNVQAVHRNQVAMDLVLPGSIEANQATTMYARSNGFLGKWFVDIGDNVKKGQTLAVIETPDLDQQLQQAESALNQAKSNFEIARVTAVRWQQLYEQKVVSAQDNDRTTTRTRPITRRPRRRKTRRWRMCASSSNWWRSTRSSRHSTGGSPFGT